MALYVHSTAQTRISEPGIKLTSAKYLYQPNACRAAQGENPDRDDLGMRRDRSMDHFTRAIKKGV